MIEAVHAFFAERTMLDAVELVGCMFSILGSELISRSDKNANAKWAITRFLNRHAKWGWGAYLVANICLIIWGSMLGRWFFVFTQAWFLKTTIVGIQNHLRPNLSSESFIARVRNRFRPAAPSTTTSKSEPCTAPAQK